MPQPLADLINQATQLAQWLPLILVVYVLLRFSNGGPKPVAVPIEDEAKPTEESGNSRMHLILLGILALIFLFPAVL